MVLLSNWLIRCKGSDGIAIILTRNLHTNGFYISQGIILQIIHDSQTDDSRSTFVLLCKLRRANVLNILAIACNFQDLDSCCLMTLSQLTRKDNLVTILIVPRTAVSRVNLRRDRSKLSIIGIEDLQYVHDFDYSCVSQRNADIIRAYVEKINPKAVFMPFWKSSNHFRNVLANTSLIACRGIGTVIMYENVSNPLFRPTIVFSPTEIGPITADQGTMTRHGIHNSRITLQPEHKLRAKNKKHETAYLQSNPFGPAIRTGILKKAEAFESHRMLLLDGEPDF